MSERAWPRCPRCHCEMIANVVVERSVVVFTCNAWYCGMVDIRQIHLDSQPDYARWST